MDEATRQKRLRKRRVMEKERRKAVQAARRRLREAKQNTSHTYSVRTESNNDIQAGP